MSLTLPTNNQKILDILRTARTLIHEGQSVSFERDTDWTEQAQRWEAAHPVVEETVRTSRVYTGKVRLTTRNLESSEVEVRR